MIAADRSPTRILVVEDNLLNLKLASKILERHGYRVDGARSGEEALERTRNARYDLVLLDIQLPEMDGLEVAQLLRSQATTREIPILAVSALARNEDRQQALLAGCNGYLSKPYGIDELTRSVRRILDMGRSEPAPALLQS